MEARGTESERVGRRCARLSKGRLLTLPEETR